MKTRWLAVWFVVGVIFSAGCGGGDAGQAESGGANPEVAKPDVPGAEAPKSKEDGAKPTEGATTTDDAKDGDKGGADKGPDKGAGDKSSSAKPEEKKTGKAPKSDPSGPFKLGDLVEAFTPPSLEELEKMVEWEDQPIVDSAAELRKKQAAEKPLATVAEALKLRNDSPEANAKILSALSRIPTREEEEKAVNWDAGIARHAAADVKSSNPILASSTIEFEVNSLQAFGLFSFDAEMKAFASPDAVKSWQASKDRLYDKVVLRDDLTWSDGTKITAHDIEFSFLAIMSSQVPVPAQRSGTDKLKYVKAYDDQTVVFFHKEALATNVWNVNFAVIPKHIYAKSIADDPTLQQSDYHIKYENTPVTGGPYAIVGRTRQQEIVLERRDSYFMHNGKQVRDKPYFKTIRFKIAQDPSVAILALKNGDIDEMQLTPSLWTSQTTGDDYYQKNTKVYAVEWVEFHFVWNCATPYFSDKQVRKALALAFDHDELIKNLRRGVDQASHGMFHETSRWAPKPLLPSYHRDIDKAEDMLDAAGWVDSDGDGFRDKTIDGKKVKFEFTVLTSNRPDRVDICTLLKQNLGEIGIAVNVRPVEFTQLQEKMQNHDFHAAFGGWGTGTDPDTTENIFGTNHERNYGKYSNPKVDELYEKGRKEFDSEKRMEIYREICRTLYEDQAYMWLYYQNAYYGFNKELRGYNFSPRGPYNYSPGFSSIYKPALQ